MWVNLGGIVRSLLALLRRMFLNYLVWITGRLASGNYDTW